jgi:FKBP12-rapamycin complex-associated protein
MSASASGVAASSAVSLASSTSTSSHAAFTSKIVADLKSKSELDRHRAARDLYTHVSTELRELDPEHLNAFLDIFTKNILDLVKSSDTAAKLGGILAIVALINADACNTGDRISRFGNYLRNNCLAGQTTVPSSSSSSSSSSTSTSSGSSTIADAAVIELASKAIARLTQVSGTYTVNLKLDLIDHELKRSIEMLQGPRHEGRRYAAVLVLREIAFSMPTFFFQNVSQFFGVIFTAINDPNQVSFYRVGDEIFKVKLLITATQS